jgi:Fe-S cluster assembly scaffold protein SufB
LHVGDDGLSFHNFSSEDRAAVAIDREVIAFSRSITSPIIMHAQVTRAMKISVAEDVLLHMVLIADGPTAVTVTCAPRSRCYLYLAHGVEERCELTSMIEQHGEMQLFEMGAGAADCTRSMTVHLLGRMAQFGYVGLDQLHGDERKRSHLVIRHQASETKSSQIFRGIYGGNADAEFLGQVVIDDHARDSSASQLYKAILLGERAKARVLPELVVHNHEVSASHGATIGELDDDALFYLCSRGLSQQSAKALLIECIATEMLDAIAHPRLRKAFMHESAHATAALIKDLS